MRELSVRRGTLWVIVLPLMVSLLAWGAPAEAATMKVNAGTAKYIASRVKASNKTLGASSCLTKATKAAAKTAAIKKKPKAGVARLRTVATTTCAGTSVKVIAVTSALKKKASQSKAAAWKKAKASKANRVAYATARYDLLAVASFSRGAKVFTIITLLDTTRPVTVTPPPTGCPNPSTAPAPAAVGAAYAGGIFVGFTHDEACQLYALVASPRDKEFAPFLLASQPVWDNHRWVQGASRYAPKASDWDGLINTQSAAAVDADYQIFQYVNALTYPADGGSRWYVPARNEVKLLVERLGPAGLAWSYVKGGNTITVTGLWSSTQATADTAWRQDISGTGTQADASKATLESTVGVRPVRRIAL